MIFLLFFFLLVVGIYWFMLFFSFGRELVRLVVRLVLKKGAKGEGGSLRG